MQDTANFGSFSFAVNLHHLLRLVFFNRLMVVMKDNGHTFGVYWTLLINHRYLLILRSGWLLAAHSIFFIVNSDSLILRESLITELHDIDLLLLSDLGRST